VGLVGPVTARPAAPGRRGRDHDAALLAAGIAVAAAAGGAYLAYALAHPPHWTLYPVDLGVYQSGGLIVRHVRPAYNPHLATPLYGWPGYDGLHLKFTYPPFAAAVFALVSFIPWRVLPRLSVAVNVVLLACALWLTVRALGWRGARRTAGVTLLLAGVLLWTEPVIRTLYLGQVNLALMAVILWDLTQPGHRWWKGAGTGIAAGVKLVPLIFIPYLLVTRRFRQAGVALAAFAATAAAGWAVLPADSARWWLGGLFADGGRTGFVGWEGNQSLLGALTRLAGSTAAGKPLWLAAAAAVGAAGLAAAAALSRAGHELPALLTVALTGLLVSPVSWDHHWVWVAPGITVAAHYGLRAARRLQWRQAAGCWGLAAGTFLLYAAWPDPLLGLRSSIAPFAFGLLWGPPDTDPGLYYRYGDQRWFHEYHWHGSQLLAGNAFLLGGLALLGVTVVAALRTLTAAGTAAAGARQAARRLPAAERPATDR
jgi:alpha-1,2-mannosyltransferase